MPVMDGLEATSIIRRFEHQERLEPAMIIALTALASAAAQVEALACGINHYLTKPVNFRALMEFLNDKMSNK